MNEIASHGSSGGRTTALGAAGVNAAGVAGRSSIKAGLHAAPFSWTGFYIGATAGAGSGETRFDAGAVSNPFDINDSTAGATIGYNWVVDLEVDL